VNVKAYSQTSDMWHNVEKIVVYPDREYCEVWEDKNADEHWDTSDLRFCDDNLIEWAKNVINKHNDLVKKYPNNQELGAKIRELIKVQ